MKKLTLILIAGLCFSVSVSAIDWDAPNKVEKGHIAKAKELVKRDGLKWGGESRNYRQKGLYYYTSGKYKNKVYFGIGGTLREQFAEIPPNAAGKKRIPRWAWSIGFDSNVPVLGIPDVKEPAKKVGKKAEKLAATVPDNLELKKAKKYVKPERAVRSRNLKAKPVRILFDVNTFKKLDANKDGVISEQEFLDGEKYLAGN